MKGILFKESLFQAVVHGNKTQTRRLLKMPEDIDHSNCIVWVESNKYHLFNDNTEYIKELKPRYKKDEVVYLKEPYQYDEERGYYYLYMIPYMENKGFKNKLFMPEKAARYFIKITDVRLEELKDITVEDIKAEGVTLDNKNASDQDYFDAWKTLWDSINKKTHPYDSNPVVWVYDFELFF